VLVADTCKECAPYQINMNAATFEEYMATSTGYIGVSWQQVLTITLHNPLQTCHIHAEPALYRLMQHEPTVCPGLAWAGCSEQERTFEASRCPAPLHWNDITPWAAEREAG
jgi:hypothetical protein